jgi:putative toxin-antitoxin system antitoxin component (TIGR02293 family)
MAETILQSVIEVLGGRSVLGRSVLRAEDLRRRVREGLPYRALEAVEGRFGLRRGDVDAVLDLPERTRMRRKKQKQLSVVESDRLYRLAHIASIASEVLGGDEKAARWLHKPNRSLGNVEPLQLLDTELGAREVEDALGRIDYGVFG